MRNLIITVILFALSPAAFAGYVWDTLPREEIPVEQLREYQIEQERQDTENMPLAKPGCWTDNSCKKQEHAPEQPEALLAGEQVAGYVWHCFIACNPLFGDT